MRIATMKAVDQRLGRALCSILSALRRAGPAEMPNAGTVRSVALVKFWGMGSIVLMTPAIAALRERYPEAKLTFVTQSANRDVCELIGVDEVLTLELSQGPFGFLKSLGGLVAAVWARRFDLWLDFEFFTRFSAILTGVSRARTTVGFHAPEIERGRLHDVRVPFNNYWHMIDNFCTIATGDFEPASFERPLPRMAAGMEAKAGLAAKLAAAGVDPAEPYVVINPNAGELALERRWSTEKFAKLADEVAALYGCKLVVIGAPSERDYVAGMLRKVRAQDVLVDLSGKTTLAEMVALFAGARLVVSNDTGPLHLACASGAKTVSIFGPETPVLFGPRGPQHRIVTKGLACSPCLNIYNGRSVSCRFATPRCVSELDVSEVLAAVRELWEGARPVPMVPEA